MKRRGKIKADLQIMAISTMNRAAANRDRKDCRRGGPRAVEVRTLILDPRLV